MLTLPKTGQGHPRVMIYINIVELHSLMLQAKFKKIIGLPVLNNKIYNGFCYL